MIVVDVHEAKTRLLELLERARRGEQVAIAQQEGLPTVRVVRTETMPVKARLGVDKGAFSVPSDFNDPMVW